jgi:NTE family protein
MNQVSANSAMLSGAPGFFVPRLPSPWLHPRGSIEATSFYDASGLRNTLENLVDFDRINAREMRFSVGAVNVRSGNFVYFDSTTHTIRPEHVMASGALAAGFAAVEIDGERYWDGGLISNTPLQWVLDSTPRQDTLAFRCLRHLPCAEIADAELLEQAFVMKVLNGRQCQFDRRAAVAHHQIEDLDPVGLQARQ